MVVNYPTVTQATKTNSAIDYENPWMFQEQPFLSEDIGDSFGFVYRITNLQTNKQYIGRKYFSRNESLEVEVGELRLKVTGKNTMDRVLNLLPTLKP